MTATTRRPTARLLHLRELLEDASVATRHLYGHLLADDDADIPAYALITRRDGEEQVLLGRTEGEIVTLANDALRHRPPAEPVAMIELDSARRRQPVLGVFFAVEEMVLPLVVANLIEQDLRDRQRDQHRNPARERELRQASMLLADGAPIPARLFPAIADVIELDLADRRNDPEELHDAESERILSDIHDQLHFRAPARDYRSRVAPGN